MGNQQRVDKPKSTCCNSPVRKNEKREGYRCAECKKDCTLKLTKEEKKARIAAWRWWENEPHKLTKLKDGFRVGCTDKEACGYANITERQLYYYQKQHPDFVGEKEVLKDYVVLLARRTVAKKVSKSYNNAMDLLKRKRKHEFGDNLDLTTGNEKLPPQSNSITFVNFSKKDEEKK